MDLAEDERKERFKNRYLVENNLHSRDISSDQIENERRLNRMAHERSPGPRVLLAGKLQCCAPIGWVPTLPCGSLPF